MTTDPGDAYRLFIPNIVVFFEAIRAGEIPLWNPWEFAGMPLLATLEFGPFYPLTLLYLLFGPADGHLVSNTAHLLILAAGCYCLNRRVLQVSPFAAIGGAITMGASGWAMYRGLMFIDAFRSFAWVPWVMFAAHVIVRNPSIRSGCALALLLCLQFLAGESEISARTGLFLLPFVCWQLWVDRNIQPVTLRRLVRIGSTFFAAGVLSLGLAAIQLLPTLEVMAQSVRTAGSLSMMQALHGGSESYIALLTELSAVTKTPEYFFVGVGTFLFASYGAAHRHRWRIFLGLAALILMSLLLGANSVLARIYFHLPTGDWFRWPSRYLPYLVIVLSMLAAIGFQQILEQFTEREQGNAPRLSRSPVAFSVFGLLFVVIWNWFAVSVQTSVWVPVMGLLCIFTLVAIKVPKCTRMMSAVPALLLALLLAVAILGNRAPEMSPPKKLDLVGVPEPLMDELRLAYANRPGRVYIAYATNIGRVVPKFGQLTGIPTMNGSSVFMPSTFWHAVNPYLLERLQSDLDPRSAYVPVGLWAGLSMERGAGKVLDLFGVRYILLSREQELFPEKSPPVGWVKISEHGRFTLWESPSALPRAFVMHRDAQIESLDHAREILLTEQLFEAEMSLPDMNTLHVTLPSDQPGGILVVSEQYYPGWRVTVDGESRELVSVGGLFRGVRVEPEDTEVEFHYVPLSFYIGAIVSGLSIALFISLVVIDWRNRRITLPD